MGVAQLDFRSLSMPPRQVNVPGRCLIKFLGYLLWTGHSPHPVVEFKTVMAGQGLNSWLFILSQL